MKSLLIIGAGGYGWVVKEIALLNGYEKIEFLDDNSHIAVGKIKDLEDLQQQYDGAIVAIGNPEIRKKVFERIAKPVTVIHPTAVVSPTAKVGQGCVIEANAVVGTNAELKKSVFVCSGAVVNHNSIVGKYSQVDCNAVVSTGADVPPYTKVHSCAVYKNPVWE